MVMLSVALVSFNLLDIYIFVAKNLYVDINIVLSMHSESRFKMDFTVMTEYLMASFVR